MSFTLRTHRDRYKQRSRESIYRGIAFTASMLAALIIGFYAGNLKNKQDTRQIAIQNQELQQLAEVADQTTTDLQANYQTLAIQYQQLTDKYKRDVPQGDLAILTAMIKDQLDKGLPSKRLMQIIRSAQPPQNCSEAVSKRFILSTATYKGPQGAITFADGAITVTGTGESSINNKRSKEAWFDPGKPVTIIFHVIGGKKEEKTGLLPLHHTIIVQNREYRFNVSEGPRSFVVVTSDSCDYPENIMQLTPKLPSEISNLDPLPAMPINALKDQ
jgi:hypothetical protein